MRITRNILEKKIQYLNEYMGENTNVFGEHGFTNIGTFVLDSDFGGYQVARIMNTSGGEYNITNRGTARETFDQINAFIMGVKIERGKM